MRRLYSVVVFAVVFSSAPAHSAAEDLIEINPAVRVSQSDFAALKETRKLLKDQQVLVRKILQKEHIDDYEVQIPEYPDSMPVQAIGAQVFANEVAYRELCHKVGAALPSRPDASHTGTSLQNERFAEKYSDALLHSVAMKLGIKVKPMVSTDTSSPAEGNLALVRQNGELLQAIADKLGAKD